MSLISTIAPLPVADHEIVVYLEVDVSGLLPQDGPATTLSEFAGPHPDTSAAETAKVRKAASPIPSDQYDALRNRYGEQRVWRRASEDGANLAGRDLHPHIRDIIDGRRPDLATLWTLTNHARMFLAGADRYREDTPVVDRIKKAIHLQPGKIALQRLRPHGVAPGSWRVSIDNVRLFAFSTGLGIAMVSIRLAGHQDTDGERPITAIELLESVAAINHGNPLAWHSARDGTPIDGDRFNLSTLIERLVFGAPEPNAHPVQRTRLYTYTYARFDDIAPIAERDTLAVSLARHYTSDYTISGDGRCRVDVRDFDTVRHAIALEGAATVVGATRTAPLLPTFLETYRTNTFRRHYAMIALIALHEHGFLLNRLSTSVLRPGEDGSDHHAIQTLERLRDDYLNFRIGFRFSEVSQISMHNGVSRAFRDALGLDRLLFERSADVGELGAHLRDLRTRRKDRAFRWASAVAAAGIGGLTSFTLFKEIGILLFNARAAGWLGVGFGLAAALTAAIVTIRRAPDPAPAAPASGQARSLRRPP